MIEPETEARPAPKVGDIANLGKPILLKDMNMAGVSAEAAQGGQKVQIWTRTALTSDQALFQRIIGSVAGAIENAANTVGEYPNLSRAQTVLLVLRLDNTGELWVDKAAMCTYNALNRPGRMAAGKGGARTTQLSAACRPWPLVTKG